MALQSPFFNNTNKREDGYPRPGTNPNAAALSGQAAASPPPRSRPPRPPLR